ncbi:Serine/threonine-protein kinase-like domain-containing protein [Candidatus Omnitrophus magneticus]|uniref:Serine/threonine-protein kinase-like domain-containing protein n=1 Tax=Candidatus Omnitrophus magneticus TaxID=1609969 RepID=A0A0F0CN23_9BACT|nr:Serine/threonine-protein kinase-like domain-containing protein [Candidatus Omnitrophus magneticus]
MLTEHRNSVLTLALSPDGKYLYSGSSDNTIKIWERDDNTGTYSFKQTLTEHSNLVLTLALSPDGKYLYSGSSDKTIKIWERDDNTGTYSFKQTLTEHSDWVLTLALSPDGKYLYSGSDDNTIKIWERDDNTGTYSFKQTLTGHSNWVRTLALSPDGKYLYSGSNDNTIKIWERDDNTGTYSFKQTLTEHSDWVLTLALSPDGKYLYSGSSDKTIKIWERDDNTGTYSFKQTLTEHENLVRTLALSPDGKYLYSGSNDNTIKIWERDDNTGTYSFKQTLTGHSAYVVTLALSPDGKYLYSGSGDTTIKIWELEYESVLDIVPVVLAPAKVEQEIDDNIMFIERLPIDLANILWQLLTIKEISCAKNQVELLKEFIGEFQDDDYFKEIIEIIKKFQTAEISKKISELLSGKIFSEEEKDFEIKIENTDNGRHEVYTSKNIKEPLDKDKVWWENWFERAIGLDKEVLNEIMRNRFRDGREGVINIPISSVDLKSLGEISEDLLEGYTRKSIKGLEKFISIEVGNVRFNLYNDSILDKGDAVEIETKLWERSKGKDGKILARESVITFAYRKEGTSARSEVYKSLERNSYTVYLKPLEEKENTYLVWCV